MPYQFGHTAWSPFGQYSQKVTIPLPLGKSQLHHLNALGAWSLIGGLNSAIPPYEGAMYPVHQAKSCMRESNSRSDIGSVVCYLYINAACDRIYV